MVVNICKNNAAGGDVLWAWHNKFAVIGISQTCKGRYELNVATARVGEMLASEVLRTDLSTIVYKWCVARFGTICTI